MDFEVIQGDIATQQADALVNAAGTSLEIGSGVAGALRRGAGEELARYEPDSLSDVRFIGYSDEEYETIRETARDTCGD